MNSNLKNKLERGAFYNIVPQASLEKVEHPCFRVFIPSTEVGASHIAVVGMWSGKANGMERPPHIGTRVNVTMNSLGFGEVEGYFIECGFIGLMVKPEEGKAPAWWYKQNADKGINHFLVFGTEVRPII